jgi:hypothetical protein
MNVFGPSEASDTLQVFCGALRGRPFLHFRREPVILHG